MSNTPSVSALVVRWQELRQQGQDVAPEEICGDCPELLDDVKRQIQVLASMSSFLGASSGETPGTCSVPTPDQVRVGEAPQTVALQLGAAASPGEAAPAGTRYRPLRLHAQGGLGEVFVALDEDLSREVALKRIRRPRAADADSRRRFLRECEITGNLEHPGVVPVYGLTRDADGQPCYVMRFIRGQTLKEAIERYHAAALAERGLLLRQLLTRFIVVCNTLAFAHSRGVVHRDLKPANVMLGDYGETLVVDWGLAKRVNLSGEAQPAPDAGPPVGPGDGVDATATGDVLGTPAFMSPEQAAGRQDLVGPASDLYGLGATLYALLTGQPPIGGDRLAEILRCVQRGEFARPRQLRPEVPRALEAVCLKAMAREPAARYATPLELAADLERWLADEPVSAYREPLPARARRFARRHQSWVAAGAAVLLAVLLLGGGSALWLLFQRAETRRNVTVDLDEAERLEREENWPDARAALERANGRLGDAGPEDLRGRAHQAGVDLALVDRLEEIFLDYADPREPSIPVRARRAADAYAAVLSGYGLDLQSLDPNVAAERINGAAIRGRLLAAVEHWAYAEARADRLGWEHLLAVAERVDADPWRLQLRQAWVRRDRPALQQLIARTDIGRLSPDSLVAMGRALGSGSADQTPETLQALRDVQRRIPADFPTNYGVAYRLYFGDKPQKAESLGFYRTALALRPHSAGLQRLVAQTLEEVDELKESEATYRAVLRNHPDDAEAHSGLGWTLWRQDRKPEAEAEYRTALEINPRLGPAHANLALVFADKGEDDEAVKEYEMAISHQPDLAFAHVGRYRALERLNQWPAAEAAANAWVKAEPESGKPYFNLAMARKEQGNRAGALAALDEAVERSPKNAFWHCSRGQILGLLGKEKEAEKAYEKARDLLEPNTVYPPISFGLGLIYFRRGEYAKAETYLKQAVSDMANAEAQYHYYLGLTLAKLGRPQAWVQFQAATEKNPDYAEAYYELGMALRQENRFAAALAALRKGDAPGAQAPNGSHRSAELVRETEHLAELEKSLPDIIGGKVAAADGDLLTLARLCQKRQFNVAAERFYAAAFAARPKLAEDFEAGDRYSAACAAARAGCGITDDGNRLDELERARLRHQALVLLRAELDLADKRLDTPEGRTAVRGRAEKVNADFQELRNPVKIAKLPKDEHEPWLQLWADLDDLLRRAQR